MVHEMALVCFSVSCSAEHIPASQSGQGSSIHPHIWISFSLVSMVSNRTEGLGQMEAGRKMQEHLYFLHTFENLFCLGVKNL